MNRSPVDATVTEVRYIPGKFFNASLDKASKDNERNILGLRDADGGQWSVVQIAGLIARRIVCKATPGAPLARGERYGMDAGCIVGPATCGPCLGGHMGILAGGERAIATTNRNFKGRMVAHDRYLLREVAGEVWAVTHEGVTVYDEGFGAYEAALAAQNACPAAEDEPIAAKVSRQEDKERKRRIAEQRNAFYRDIKPKRAVYDKLEAELEKLLTRQSEVEATMLRAVELLRGEIETVFTKVREADITAAREMLILGTTNDCLSIVRYNGAPVGDGTPGPVSKRIKALLTADIAATGVPL